MRIYSAFLLVLTIGISFAQSPQAINYQTVVRDDQGAIIPNQSLSFKIEIREGGLNGTAVYEETHKQVSNDLGLVDFRIGLGQNPSGSFSAINWGQNEYYLNIQLDPGGGTNYTDMGTQQLVSVPYALYAEKSGSSLEPGNGIVIANDSIHAKSDTAIWNAGQIQDNIVSDQAPQPGQVLMWDGNAWVPTTPPSNTNNTLIYTTRGF